MKLDGNAQPGGEKSQRGTFTAVLVVLVVSACILACTMIFAVPTGSISATTVYRGF
jgi:hypothetical protein